jgi:hypothetical protein
VRAAAVDEPIASSARLALELASTLCHKDPATGVSCAWYHGPWQLFRLMGLVMTPAQHAEFYQTAIDAVARPGSTRHVLISAAADYSMLAHVLAALRARNVASQVTVVDVCDTPLALNRWYAEQIGYPIQTCRRDIFEYAADQPFDLICTNAFFGRFPLERHLPLVEKWRELLGRGGAVITVNRILPSASVEAGVFSPEQAGAFRAAVSRAAEFLPRQAAIDPRELDRLAELYTAHQLAYPVRTREEFQALFEQAGFALEHISWGQIPFAGTRRDVSGPGVPGTSEYGRIIAIRP